jgi:hypothetical protein
MDKNTRGFTKEQKSSIKNLPEEILPNIIHKWYESGDYRQEYVQYAYKLGWLDFVLLLECENGLRDLNAIGDKWHAHWLCQMNDLYHNIPKEYFNSRQYQIEYCYEKYKWWTKFYGPSRIIRWQRCSSYVLDRFIIQ